ncbi:MAG: hypothetical protein AAB562_04505 [Patescibacteria group bacterium]
MEKVSTKMNSLIEVLGDVSAHLHPEMLNEPYKSEIDVQNCNKKKLNEYQERLLNIKVVYDKILKYELYFAKFYPQTDKITNSEALEHHIHAYLEDLDRLRNKLTTFLGLLRSDLRKIAFNKIEIAQALKQFIEKIEKVFNQVKKYRHPHHHNGFDFSDSDLVTAEAMQLMLQDNFSLKDRLNIELVRKRGLESFEVAKNNWIARSKTNNEQLCSLMDMVFKSNKNLIYKVLKINSIIG